MFSFVFVGMEGIFCGQLMSGNVWCVHAQQATEGIRMWMKSDNSLLLDAIFVFVQTMDS